MKHARSTIVLVQSSLSDVLRFILRSIKEIPESKLQLISLAVTIRISHGSFASFWSTLTQAPSAPFVPQITRALLYRVAPLGVQCTAIALMWKLFRRRQIHLPSPWKDIDVSFILQLLPTWSAPRRIHFFLVKLGFQRGSAIHGEPWHFDKTLSMAYTWSILWAAMRRGGLDILVTEVHSMIQWSLCHLLIKQALAAFQRDHENSVPPIDYRHKPVFAWAALGQGCTILLLACCGVRGYTIPSPTLAVLFHVVLTTPVATLLLYAVYAQNPHYLNESMLGKGTFRGRTKAVFCETCRSTALTSRTGDSRHGQHHHLTATSLNRAATSGCRICATLWERRSRIPKDFVKDLKYWEPTTTYSRHEDTLIFDFKQDLRGTRRCHFRLLRTQELDRQAHVENDPRPQAPLLPVLSDHTGDDDSMKQAANWLQSCLIYHGVCNKNRVVTLKPSRLLWLGSDKVSVHLEEDMPKRVFYLTLSHCWGKSHSIKLSHRNQEALRTDIPWDNLPKTFQDAIILTRRLGFFYLWIDSLCIIQDSTDDWNREAKLMGQIYQNAVCNIAASNAGDNTHGCLYSRDPCILQPAILPSKFQEEEEYLINETDIFDDHILYTRAWVLQEALLARRTLDCGRGQLYWRCGETRASEIFPSGVPQPVRRNYEDHPALKFETLSLEGQRLILDNNILDERLRSGTEISRLNIPLGKVSIDSRPNSSTFGLWATIVGYYTEMNLTKDTDRPVALAGVIDIFRPFWGANCYGLWHIYLPVELLWTAKADTVRPPGQRAPSWSWMSLEGSMTYQHCHFKYGVDVLVTQFVGIERKEHETQLHLTAPLLRATWRLGNASQPGGPALLSSLEGNTQPEMFMGMRFGTKPYGNIKFDYNDGKMPMEDIFCVPIKVGPDKLDHWSYSQQGTSGLVLHERRDGAFVRLGQFEAHTKSFLPLLRKNPNREIKIV